MARRSKYGNKRTVVDGITFASKAEAKRYGELKLLERSGYICELKRQPRFKLLVCGVEVCTYVGDFQYWEVPIQAGSRPVVEDVKGYETEEFKVKWAVAKASLPGIDWRLVPAKAAPAPALANGRA